MTIAYPRAMPSTRVLRHYFEPEPAQSSAPESSGRGVSIALGETLWQMKLDTTPASEAEFDLWRAWLASLRGSQKLFYGRDMYRPLPRAYPQGFADLTRAGGGAFDGTSASWSVAGDAVTINTLPASFRMQHGDYIGFQWDTDKRSLHRALEDASANGSGVGVWTVEPGPSPSIPNGAVVNLVRPTCTMFLTSRDADREHKSRRISFEAMQYLEF